MSALQEYGYGMDDTEEAGDRAGDAPQRHGTAQTPTDGDGDAPRPSGADSAAGSDADFRALAEDWIAIWQSEITAYLTDPETQQAWGAMMAVWAGAAQAMMRAMPPAPGFGTGFGAGFPGGYGAGFGAGTTRRGKRPKPASGAADDRGQSSPPESSTTQSAGSDAAARAAPVAAAPVARDDEVRRLEQRVAELERHLADQERRQRAAGENRRPRRASRPRS